jgi:hypothetical protein
MRRARLFFAVAGLLAALSACRTPFKPPTVPLANLYPTLHPSGILDSSRALRLTAGEVTALLVRLELLGPLQAYGMGPGEVPLVVRGLERHGYAELDARRSASPVHWVVLRGVVEAGETCLLLEAGLAAPPAGATPWGIDVAAPPATVLSRTDIYGRRSQVETWRGVADKAPVEVRRVIPAGRPRYWELAYRQRLQGPAGEGL